MSDEKYPDSEPLPYWMAKRVPLGAYVDEAVASYRACRRQASCHQAHCSEGTQLCVCACGGDGEKKGGERRGGGEEAGAHERVFFFSLFLHTHRLDDPVSKMTLKVWGGVPNEISP